MTEDESNELPTTLDELCDYIIKYADDIYVRENINGKWGSYALSEIPAMLALKHTIGWIKEGVVPHRIIRSNCNKLQRLRRKTDLIL